MNLRKLELKDAPGMLEWMHDPDIQKCFRFNTEKKTLDDVTKFIQAAEITPMDGKDIHLAIVNEKDEYLGTISLKEFDAVAMNAEYAISLRKCAQGKGVGTEATKEILKFAFNKFGLEKVYLNVLADNKAAIRMYERIGFIYEGEFRKHLFLRGEYKTLKWYSLLKEEYRAKYEE